MKFELVEPPEDIGDGASHLPPKHRPTVPGPATAPGLPAPADGQDDPFPDPVRVRLTNQIEGVRSSLELLRAHAAELSMAATGHTVSTTAGAEPAAEFHAHRFHARAKDGDR